MAAASFDIPYEARSSGNEVILSCDLLRSIREQISVSLDRTRELEEQVKSIPCLQAKLLTLKKEKQWLMSQLKNMCNNIDVPYFCCTEDLQAVSADFNKNVEYADFNVIGEMVECDLATSVCSPCPGHILNRGAGEKSCVIDSKHNECDILLASDTRKNTKTYKDAGTSCAVLTRDIGVGHVPNKLTSTGVGKESAFDLNLVPSSMSDEGEYDVSGSSESVESCNDCMRTSEIASSCTTIAFEPPLYSTIFSVKENYLSGRETVDETRCAGNVSVLHMDSEQHSTCCKVNLFSKQLLEKEGNCKNVSTVTDLKIADLLACKCYELKKEAKRKCSLCFLSSKMSKAIQVEDRVPLISEVSKAASCVNSSEYCEEGNLLFKLLSAKSCLHSVEKDEVEETADAFSSSPVVFNSKTLSSAACYVPPSNFPHDQGSKQNRTVGVGETGVNQFLCNYCAENAVEATDCALRTRSVGINTAAYLYATEKPSKCNCVNIKNMVKTRTDMSSTLKTLDNCLMLEGDSDIKSSSSGKEVTGICVITETPMTLCSRYQSPYQSKILSKYVSNERTEPCQQLKDACSAFRDALSRKCEEVSKGTAENLDIIQHEWFHTVNKQNADPRLVECYLDIFEDYCILQHILDLVDENGNTAIHYAASYGNFDVVSILLDCKACDVNKKNKAGYTSVMLAALASVNSDADYFVVQRLFNLGDINARAIENGQTALMLAASHGKTKVVEMLLEAGAEVNLQDNDGSTALMCAAEHGHSDIVCQLLSHPECDSSIVDCDGSSALTIAMEAGNNDIALLIYASMRYRKGKSSIQGSVISESDGKKHAGFGLSTKMV